MASHDHAYKLLFSHPRMVRDLLVGFVRGGWRARLDLRRLDKANAHFVTDSLRTRTSDVVWRLRAGKRDSVYLLLEFQSKVDRFMAVRILTYVGLLYQDLIKSGQVRDARLPLVIPVVLYHGSERWNAPTSLGAAVRTHGADSRGLRAPVRYELIDVRKLRLDAPDLKRNLAAAMFRIENSHNTREILERLALLNAMLKGPDATSLRRAFAAWVYKVVLVRLKGKPVEKVSNLEEMYSMLSDRYPQWEAGFRAKGRREGLREGRREGAREGKAEILLTQLRGRFGRQLPEWVQRQLRRATSAQLTRLGKRLLDAETLDDLFRPQRRIGR